MSTIAVLGFLVGSAAAQVGLQDRIQKITVPIQNAGVHDISAGTWTSRSSHVREVVYDNTCFSGGYYISIPADMMLVDEGQLPGPATASCLAGCASSYAINAFQIAYCTYNAAPEVIVQFDTQYQLCNWSTMFNPVAASFVVQELPGSPEPGTLSCWTVTIELGQPFVLAANGGGSVGPFGRFGWSIQFTTSQGEAGNEGPVFAGAITGPGSCPRCAGTVWDPLGQDNLPAGTGLGTQDGILVFHPDLQQPTCIFSQGGSPQMYSLWLELHSDEACPPEPGTSSCFGTTALCPCGNGGYADTGCDNPHGTGGVRLRVFDFAPNGLGGGTARIEGSNFPFSTNPSAIVVRSPSAEEPPVVFGDGLRCVGLTNLVRLGATAATGGISSHPINHGAGSGTFHYQIWYRSQPASFCDASAAFNLSSAYTLVW